VKVYEAVFATDAINKHKMKIPAAVLAESLEGLMKLTGDAGVPFGTPSNMSHDVHRVVGWAVPVGLLMTGDMARLMGRIHLPELPEEEQAVLAFRKAFLDTVQAQQATPFIEELLKRLPEPRQDDIRFDFCEATVARRAGIASHLFPRFFDQGSDIVDKDGLTDYRKLLKATRQVAPGIFHERKADLLLFAHPFMRRSLSRRNPLNANLLQTIDRTAQRAPHLRVRLRLDPDMVGHPASAKTSIELEYWRGPKFSNDIATIPPGATVHKADDRTRMFAGVDRTEFWWKAEEQRIGDDPIRTFEAEELVEDPSSGDTEERYGCRYMHAEYDSAKERITHFDGAIRQYEGEAYLRRLDSSIDRAGKHSIYTKLFRFDGELPVQDWKDLASDHFRGNTLVGEYLGGKDDPAFKTPPEGPPMEPPPPPDTTPKLAALIRYERDQESLREGAQPETRIVESHAVDCVEIVQGALGRFVAGRTSNDVLLAVTQGDSLNLPHIFLGPAEKAQQDWGATSSDLSRALREDCEKGRIQTVSVSLGWSCRGFQAWLSFGGETLIVARFFDAAKDIIHPVEEPSRWIGALNDVLVRLDGSSPQYADPLALFGGERVWVKVPEGPRRVTFLARSEEARRQISADWLTD
jgi:hypothetical protein